MFGLHPRKLYLVSFIRFERYTYGRQYNANKVLVKSEICVVTYLIWTALQKCSSFAPERHHGRATDARATPVQETPGQGRFDQCNPDELAWDLYVPVGKRFLILSERIEHLGKTILSAVHMWDDRRIDFRKTRCLSKHTNRAVSRGKQCLTVKQKTRKVGWRHRRSKKKPTNGQVYFISLRSC